MTARRVIVVLSAVVAALAAYGCTIGVFHHYGAVAAVLMAWPLAILAGFGLSSFWE